MKTYQPWNPRQSFLLPPSLDEWLPESHLVYLVLDVVAALDISDIERDLQSKDPRGQRPYDPRMMLALLIYAYCHGITSSRQIARLCWHDVAFRVLACNAQPAHTTIADFRVRHLPAIQRLFKQVLQLCRRAGLVSLGHVALDGTKVSANASKHKAMGYARMLEKEKRLDGLIRDLTAKATATDAAEDVEHGRGVSPEHLPAELRRQEQRRQRIAEAREALEAEAAQARAEVLLERAATHRDNAQAAETEKQRQHSERLGKKAQDEAEAHSPPDDDGPRAPPAPTAMPQHQVQHDAAGKPDPKAQRNFTDPESRICKRGNGYGQDYNCQAAVDEAHHIIVAEGVGNQPPDSQYLPPMVARMRENLDGDLPSALSADTGYLSAANVAACEAAGVVPHIAIGRQKHGTAPADAPALMPATEAAREKMRTRLATTEGKQLYAKRKSTVEPVFGHIKGPLRFRQFSLRGLAKVAGEWALMCLCHNLLKLLTVEGAWRRALPAA